MELVEQGGFALQARVVEMLGASQQINTMVSGELFRISTAAYPTVAAGAQLQVRAKANAARWYDAGKKRVA